MSADMGLTPEQLREIEQPDVTVLVNGVPEPNYVVMLPSPGWSRLYFSDNIPPKFIVVAFRATADIVEAKYGN